MPSQFSPRTISICSKPSGEHCRLHNPAPSVKVFANANDVFDRVNEESRERELKKAFKENPDSSVVFQNRTDTRKLADNVPLNLDEHAELSREALQHLNDDEKNALRGYTGFAAAVCNNILLGKKYEYYDKAPLWRETVGPCDFVNREDLVDYMQTVDSILAPRQEEKRIVYRGIPIYSALHDEIGEAIGKKLSLKDTEGLVEGLKEYYKAGKVFNFKTYLSTTLSAYYAAERSENTFSTKADYFSPPAEIKGIVFEMKTNAGLDATGAAKKSHAYEREVILPRDTYFKVTNVYVKPETYDTIAGYNRKSGELEQQAYKGLAVVVQMVEVDSKGNEINHKQLHKPKKAIEDIIS